jgi:dihydrolipoamide dehydrogenase
MSKIVIVGGGIAGISAALELKKNHEVVLIERNLLGGTCLNKGCIPTKSLFYSSRNSPFEESFQKAKTTVKLLRESVAHSLSGVKIIFGNASIETDRKIKINETEEEITFDYLILATGSKPVMPDILNGVENVYSSDTIFDLSKRPRRIVIIGGGYIGIEFASIFSNFGCQVLIIEQDVILKGFNKDTRELLKKEYSKKGIRIFEKTEIEKITNGSIYLDKESIPYEIILNAAGRKINEMGSKVHLERNGLETNYPHIFRIGDVAEGPMLAHKSEYDARWVSRKINGERMAHSYDNIPYCVFSRPAVCMIGDISEKNDFVKVNFSAIGKTHCSGNTEGFLKIFFKDNKIAGAEIINENAIDILSMLTILINLNATVDEARKIIFPHPTDSEIITEALKLKHA